MGRSMNLSQLLGRHLKDDAIVDVLQVYDIEVRYDFDRSHENLPDAYWAAAPSAGFQFRFNEHQMLDVIFCYAAARDEFLPIAPGIIGVPLFASYDEAEAACRAAGHAYRTPDPVTNPKYHRGWLRVETPERHTHYEFRNDRLELVTLTLPDNSGRD